MFGCNTHLLKHIKQAILAWSFRQNIILGCYPVFAAISARDEFIVWVFSQQDLVTDPLTSHDLVLCRHTLFHLKLSDIRRVLANFVASGSRYLLMTQQEQTCKLCWTMSNLPP